MAIDITKGFQKLTRTVQLGENGYHQDYARTVHLADKYKKLITGENIASLLVQFTPRETEEQFAQRLRLTQSVTPAMAEKIMNPFNKVGRLDNVVKGIIVADDEENAKEIKLKSAMDSFYGDETLDDYMETRFTQLSFADPNSFLAVEFDQFNEATESASPYPLEVPSKDAINYEYINNVLQYLIVKKTILFKVKGNGGTKLKEGISYRIYLENEIVVLTQMDSKLSGRKVDQIDITNLDENTRVKIGNTTYSVEVFSPEGGQVQALRIGYKRDIETDGRTYVSPLHPALSRFMKSIKSVSEFDITQTAHVFHQKLQYVEACKGNEKSACNHGKDINGHKCGVCHGTGVIIHRTASDSITMPLPKRKEEMYDLDKLLVYKNPPVDLIKFQKEYGDDLEQKALTDIFVSESLARITGNMTATEKVVDMESIYDTLFPYANKYSVVYKKLAGLIAEFTDTAEGTTVVHQFPKDFKLKSVNALLNDLKEANEANAPEFLRTEIANDIANKVYANNSEALRKYGVKQQHIPFKGKLPMEVQMVLNSDLTPQDDKVLYSNFEAIFTELEKDAIGSKTDFYQMPFDIRVEKINEKIDEFKTRIATDKIASNISVLDLSLDGNDIETPIDIEAEAKAKLKGTVGGVQGILSINLAVANKQLTESSAEEMLIQIYGFTPEQADKLIEPITPDNLPTLNG